MITTTQDYKNNVMGDERQFKVKVLVYFDPAKPTTFWGSKVVGLNLLEEAHSDSTNPLGIVSANEITIHFDNSLREFTQTNKNSAYYGMLKPNVKVEPYLGLVMSGKPTEFIPLGIFWTGDWACPPGSVEATVTCHDRLGVIGELDLPQVPVQKDITLYDLLKLMFDGLDLEEGIDYYIDPTITQPLQYGWLPKGKVKESLQSIAIAGQCKISSDRKGRVTVYNNYYIGTPSATYTDSDSVFGSDNPVTYLKTYSSVKVNYKMPTLETGQNVLNLDSFVIPSGTTTFTDVELSSGPVANINSLTLTDTQNSTITLISYGAWSVTFSVTNTGAEEIGKVSAVGSTIKLTSSSYTKTDDQAILDFGIKTLEVNNDLIQSLSVTRDYADALLQFVVDPAATVTVDFRGDPALEIGDIVKIQNPSEYMDDLDITPTRITLDYDGALVGKIEGRKPIAPMTWIMICPGCYVQQPYRYRQGV